MKSALLEELKDLVSKIESGSIYIDGSEVQNDPGVRQVHFGFDQLGFINTGKKVKVITIHYGDSYQDKTDLLIERYLKA